MRILQAALIAVLCLQGSKRDFYTIHSGNLVAKLQSPVHHILSHHLQWMMGVRLQSILAHIHTWTRLDLSRPKPSVFPVLSLLQNLTWPSTISHACIFTGRRVVVVVGSLHASSNRRNLLGRSVLTNVEKRRWCLVTCSGRAAKNPMPLAPVVARASSPAPLSGSDASLELCACTHA